MFKKFISSIALLSLFIAPQLTFASFSDVPKDSPQYEAIKAMENEKVIKGYEDKTFQPDKLITRAEFLKMTFSHIGYKPTETSAKTNFNDVPEDSWVAPYLKKALELGSVSFNPELPNFFPDQPLTKIEALKILMPLEGIPAPYAPEKTNLIFKDINDNSSYRYLVVAAQNSGIYINSKDNKFYPFKNLTRGEAAELLYYAELYRDSNHSGSISNNGLSSKEIALINSPEFPILVDVWGKINTSYFDKENLHQDALLYGAVSGMVNSLEDPYSIFESPEKAEVLLGNLTGTFEGIGTIIDSVDGDFVVLSLLKNSPADAAGVRPGDIIKKVNNKDTSTMNIETLINSIKGKAGSKVEIDILRGKKNLTFKITRAEISINTVLTEEPTPVAIPDDIGYISIYQFTPTTSDEFETVLANVLAKKPKGIILDLRDNPGGYLNVTYKVLGHFIPEGKVIINFKIAGEMLQEKSKGKGEINGTPLVVLVNKNTASAAEVVAGAIQDYKIGTIVGEKTFGKGTAQEVTEYTDGSVLKLSVEYWLTPLKNNLNKIGLTPDVTVKMTEDDYKNKKDPQLQKALDLLK